MENYFLDDGTYLVSKVLIELARMNQEGKKIQSLIEDLDQPYESREYRLKIKSDDFARTADLVLEEVRKMAQTEEDFQLEEPNHEGVKIRFPKGWFLIRKSLHQPVMPLNIQVDGPGVMEAMMDRLREFIKEQNGIEF